MSKIKKLIDVYMYITYEQNDAELKIVPGRVSMNLF